MPDRRSAADLELDMDTSLTVKPRDPVTRTSGVRASVARTEVAPTQTVRPATAVDPNHQQAPAQDTVSRDLVDPEGREVIYRVRDEREQERERRRKHPDEALMRQRAYGRAATPAPGESADNGDAHADIEI
jgi:hypothetical protein